jgi:hypothetical protein
VAAWGHSARALFPYGETGKGGTESIIHIDPVECSQSAGDG